MPGLSAFRPARGSQDGEVRRVRKFSPPEKCVSSTKMSSDSKASMKIRLKSVTSENASNTQLTGSQDSRDGLHSTVVDKQKIDMDVNNNNIDDDVFSPVQDGLVGQSKILKSDIGEKSNGIDRLLEKTRKNNEILDALLERTNSLSLNSFDENRLDSGRTSFDSGFFGDRHTRVTEEGEEGGQEHVVVRRMSDERLRRMSEERRSRGSSGSSDSGEKQHIEQVCTAKHRVLPVYKAHMTQTPQVHSHNSVIHLGSIQEEDDLRRRRNNFNDPMQSVSMRNIPTQEKIPFLHRPAEASKILALQQRNRILSGLKTRSSDSSERRKSESANPEPTIRRYSEPPEMSGVHQKVNRRVSEPAMVGEAKVKVLEKPQKQYLFEQQVVDFRGRATSFGSGSSVSSGRSTPERKQIMDFTSALGQAATRKKSRSCSSTDSM